MAGEIHVVTHPVAQHKLTLMRRKETSTQEFRRLLDEISVLLAYEATRDLPLGTTSIETPLTRMDAPILEGKKLAVVSVLRAGEGILAGFLSVIPAARVGHIGLYRDPETLEAVQYYLKLPEDLEERDVIVVDPMLATGHSAVAAIGRIRERSPRTVKLVSLIAAPEGIAAVHAEYPDVAIYTVAVDSHLNDHGYIVPGLGDAGDRLFGTK